MDKVQVLLSTYNGEKYIEKQIESIINQKEVEIHLLIRDDGSTDNTMQIVEKMAKNNENIQFYIGENVGPARSFMDLLRKSEEADYYAFADQDDVWYENKVISAINMLKKEKGPSMYISALEIVDENLNKIEIKKVSGNFTFEGELVKNFATGCTQVLNKKMRDIVNEYNPSYIIMHDSWITRVCYAIGGTVIIDENAYIKYRQHQNNVVGYKQSEIKKVKKQYEIAFKKNECMRVKISEELKKGYENKLTKNAKEVIKNVLTYRENFKAKWWLLSNRKFRTNKLKINIKVVIAIILNKF